MKDQHLYKDLPTTGAEKPSLRITLNKAVQFMNERGPVSAVQKAGRNAERAKRRRVTEANNADTIVVEERAPPAKRVTRGDAKRGSGSRGTRARGRGSKRAT